MPYAVFRLVCSVSSFELESQYSGQKATTDFRPVFEQVTDFVLRRRRFFHPKEFPSGMMKLLLYMILFKKVDLLRLLGFSKRILVLLILGLLGVLAGVAMVVIDPYDVIFKYKATFADGGEMFELWRKPPIDLYIKVWLWNVTNRDEFLAGKEKLKVNDVGPYVYKELFTHESVVFNPNGTMTFIPKHPLVWVPELSEGRREDDMLILPNIALLSFSNVMSTASTLTRLGVSVIVTQTDSQPLVNMTAREFMFGYESPLVTLGNKVMPSWIMFDKLGLIDRMYDFRGDTEVDYTGEGNVSISGLISHYNGRPSLPHWEDHCGNVQLASDGTKFMSFMKPNTTYSFFRKSMCRAMPIVPVGERSKQGLLGREFTFEDNALDNGEVNPSNKCFCRKGKCLPKGLIDVQDCYYGFPIAVGYPHFYQGDKSLTDAIDGFSPDPKRHGTTFLVEPITGMPLEVSVRTQINMALGDISMMSRVQPFSHMVLPLLWSEITMPQLPDFMVTKFKIYLHILPVLVNVIQYTLIVSGCALVAACLFIAFGRPCRPEPEARRGSRAWLQDQDMNVSNKNLPELLVVAERERTSKKFTFGGRHAGDRELQVYSSLLSPNDVPDHMSSNASSRRTSFEQAYC